MQIERDAYRSMLKDVGGDDAEKWANQYKKVQLKKNKILQKRRLVQSTNSMQNFDIITNIILIIIFSNFIIVSKIQF